MYVVHVYVYDALRTKLHTATGRSPLPYMMYMYLSLSTYMYRSSYMYCMYRVGS